MFFVLACQVQSGKRATPFILRLVERAVIPERNEHYDFGRPDLPDSTPSRFREMLACNHIHHEAQSHGSEESTSKQKMYSPLRDIFTAHNHEPPLCFGTA